MRAFLGDLWWGVVGVIAGAILLVFGVLSQVSAHGPAQWINDGHYKNAAGELCCGERDCFELASEDIQITEQGYFIRSLKETVPFSQAQPSPDGHYWRCAWGGERKCFFAPPGAV